MTPNSLTTLIIGRSPRLLSVTLVLGSPLVVAMRHYTDAETPSPWPSPPTLVLAGISFDAATDADIATITLTLEDVALLAATASGARTASLLVGTNVVARGGYTVCL